MSDIPRKKSPRAPSIALDTAIDRVQRVYDKEGRHSIALEIVAQDLGYKGANNGAFLTTIASLRYFGLVDRPKEGHLAVSKDFESFKFAPTDELRRDLKIKWLKNPTIFAELLQQYGDRLPSDATIRYDLIHRGFSPKAAEDCVAVFRKSVDYSRYYDAFTSELQIGPPGDEVREEVQFGEEDESGGKESRGIERVGTGGAGVNNAADGVKGLDRKDRIPVRLTGGRRAWLEIPEQFYEADKKRLIAQIELILTEDADGDIDS